MSLSSFALYFSFVNSFQLILVIKLGERYSGSLYRTVAFEKGILCQAYATCQASIGLSSMAKSDCSRHNHIINNIYILEKK